jgi:hypothetical protein
MRLLDEGHAVQTGPGLARRHCPIRRLARHLSAFTLVAVTAACSSSPSPADPYHGTWTGTIVDRAVGPGTVRVDLRAGARLEGSWTATIGGASYGGTLTSEATSGTARSFAVVCGAQGAMLWATSVSGGSLSGTYITASCGSLGGGSFELRRQ